MSVRTDVINLNVNINGDKGKNELNQLRKKAADLTAEMKGLSKSSQEYKDKAAELKVVSDRMVELRKQIGLTALSQKELVSELKRLQAMKNVLTPQTKEFNDLQKQIDAVTSRLKDVKAGTFGFKSFLGSIKEEVKQFGVLAAGYLGLDFVTSQAQNLIRMQSRLADEQSNIQKTTSLTSDQVKELDKELRKMDTRTSNSRLRQLAAEAGKLGIDGVAGLKKFVEEADKIEVALGEDLGEEGLIKIAKLSGIFNEGMTNVASGINAVGQASAASEAYQVDLAFRMAGTAQTAKIAAGDILGYAAALEVNGQTAEVSATALNTFFLDFIAGANKFGKAAGFAKGELGKIINEKGVNEAFLQFLQRLKDSSKGTDDFIRKMKDLGVDSARGSNVMLVLSNNIDQVRAQQDLANKSIQEGTSIINEYNTKNNNFAAIVDRVSKAVSGFFTSDKINGWIVGLITGFEKLLGILPELVNFISKNIAAFALWALAYAIQVGWIKNLVGWIALQITGVKGATLAQTYLIIAEKADIIATTALGMAKALLSGNLSKLRQEFKLLTAALNTNPWTVLLAVVGAVIVAVNTFGSSTKKSASEQRLLAELTAEAAKKMSEILTVQKTSVAVLKDERASLESKKKALDDIIALNPTYLSGLSKANILTKEGTGLLEQYNQQMLLSFKQQAAYARVQDEQNKANTLGSLRGKVDFAIASGDGISYDDIPKELRDKFLQKTNRSPGITSIAASIFDFTVDDKKQLAGLRDILDDEIANAQKKVEDAISVNTKLTNQEADAKKQTITQNIALLEKELATLKKTDKEYSSTLTKLNASKAELDRLNGVVAPEGSNNLSTGDGRDKAAEKEFKRLQKIREEIQKLNDDISAMEEDAKNKKGYNDELEIQKVKDKYAKLLIEAKKYAAESAQLTELQKRELDVLFQKQFDRRNQKEYEESLTELGNYFNRQRQLVDEDFTNKKTNSVQHQLQLKQIDRQETTARIQIATDYSDTVKKATTDLETFKTQSTKQGVDDRIAESEKETRSILAKANLAVLTAKKGSSARLEAEKDFLEEQYNQAVATGQYTNDELLSMHAEMLLAKKELDKQYWDNMVQEVQATLQGVADVFSGYMDVQANRENKELADDKSRNDKKKANLKSQLDNKIISQSQYDATVRKLDDDYDKKQKEYAIKQAKRQKSAGIFNAIINTAQGVSRAFSDYGWPFNLIVAALVGAAGALQVEKIASEPLPTGRKGLIVQGPSHEASGITMVNNQTGKPVANIEGGEPVMVLSKNTYGNNKELIDELIYNSNFKNGAKVAAADWYNAKPQSFNTVELIPAMRYGGIVNATQLSRNNNSNNNSIADFGMLLTLNETNNNLMKELINGQRDTIASLTSQNNKLRSFVVLQDIEDQKELMDKAKSLRGINQKIAV